MKKRITAILLTLALAYTLIPATTQTAQAAEPYTALEDIAYYGDRTQCAMTAEQAKAMIQTIQEEMKKPTGWGGGIDDGYAALFDTGNGIPALFFVRGYGDEHTTYDDGEMYSLGYSRVWTYQDGEMMPFTEHERLGGDIWLYDTCIVYGTSNQGSPGYNYGIYPISSGVVANVPLHTYGLWCEDGDYSYSIEHYEIDGAGATEEQVRTLREQWCKNVLLSAMPGGGVEYWIDGLTPIGTVQTALSRYITVAEGSTRVQLHLNGGSGGTARWTSADGTIQVPTNPIREGYNFGGWYVDEALTTPWNFNSAVTGDLSLYAMWLPISSTATQTGRSSQAITVNGESVSLEAYTLAADSNGGDVTYVRLRDVAAVLDGTEAQFNVDWRNGAIYVDPGTPYTTRNGAELQPIEVNTTAYQWNTSPILFDGVTKPLEGIVITDVEGGGHTFFKLRDLGAAIGFTVDWSAETGIFIETK